MLKIREANPGDFEKIASIHSVVWPSNPIDAAELSRDHETMEPHLRTRFAIAEADDRAVGICELYRDIGSFHPQRWTAVISVLPDFRRRGIGTALYAWMQEGLSGGEVLAIESKAHEGDLEAHVFATRRGFIETKRDFVSELDLGSCIPPPVLLPAGVVIRSLAEVEGHDIRRLLHETFEEVRADVPRTYPPTPTPFEFFDEHVWGDPNFLPDATFLAFAGEEIAGFSGAFTGVEDGIVDQWLTGVRRPWRGRGLALCLKVRGIRWAQANGYRIIRTDNDSRNVRMLAINERLGFVRRCGLVRYQWTPVAS